MSYITDRRDRWSVALLCRTFGVSESSYYKFLRLNRKSDKHANLLAQIDAFIREDEENANDGVRRIDDYLRLKRNDCLSVYPLLQSAANLQHKGWLSTASLSTTFFDKHQLAA